MMAASSIMEGICKIYTDMLGVNYILVNIFLMFNSLAVIHLLLVNAALAPNTRLKICFGLWTSKL